jgi:SAM-dependent methyltransferase
MNHTGQSERTEHDPEGHVARHLGELEGRPLQFLHLRIDEHVLDSALLLHRAEDVARFCVLHVHRDGARPGSIGRQHDGRGCEEDREDDGFHAHLNRYPPDVISRRDRARARFAPLLRGRGLEIGALNAPYPFLPGTEVVYSDVLSREQVAAMYPGSRLPDIQSDSESFPTIASDSLDFIVANHVLEHVTSPIDALAEWRRMLREGGVLMLALPDKRFTFDAPRSRTTLAHLIADSQSKDDPRDRNYAHLEEWATHVEKLSKGAPEWRSWIDAQYARGYAVHNHVWVALDVLRLIRHVGGWSVIVFRNSPVLTNEFILILRKEREPRAVNIALLRAWLAEPANILFAVVKQLIRGVN